MFKNLLSITKLHWSWWIAFTLITYSFGASYRIKYPASIVEGLGYGAATAIFILISILIHEAAHAVVAISHGINVNKIRVFFFGGIAEFDRELSDAKTEMAVAIAGPAVSLLIAGGLYLLKRDEMSDYLMRVQIFIAGINMIPVFPLDGGKVLRSLLWKFFKDYIRATKITIKFSSILGGIFLATSGIMILCKSIGYGIWFLFIGLLVKITTSAYRSTIPFNIVDKKVSELMIPKERVVSVPEDTTISDFLSRYFAIHGFHGYPVVSEAKPHELKGIVSYWYVRRLLKQASISSTDTVSKVMFTFSLLESNPDQPYIKDDTIIEDAYKKMIFNNFSRLIVLDGNNNYIGLITRSALLRQDKILSSKEGINETEC